MFISAMFTDNKYTAFFGENQRRNGFLTYFSLTIVLLTVIGKLNKTSITNIYFTSIFTGLILGGYGVFQTMGMDFVKWNNPYNSVISTVGNPNFAAAIMAIIAVVNLGPVFTPVFNKYIRTLFGFSVVLLLFAIYRSDARQGVISFAVGSGAFLGIWVIGKNKKLGLAYFISFLFLGILAILGMLQMGPLKEFLYKPSISVRGFYWRAGLAMLKDNPIFGVGIDRYGAYFKEYRETQYSLNYGFDITSTNAHNTPIQLLATGGILVGSMYLALVLAIAVIGIKGLRSTNGNQNLILGSFFAGWLAFQAQSLISIDNIGISIWGWFLGGIIVALSRSQLKEDQKTKIKLSSIQPLISGTLAIVSLVLVFTLYRGEVNMFQTRIRYNPQSETNAAPLKEFADKTINTPLIEPYYKFTSATYLITSGYVKEGMEVLKKINASDPRDLDTLRSLGEYEAQLGKNSESINYFKEIAKLDQWNAQNYLTLGRLYKATGNFVSMNEMKEKIISFAANTEVGKNALIELVNP
jgi:O-antigen ligase